MRIAVVAPSCTLRRDVADRVQQLASQRGDCELLVHPQCFLVDGHFAGSDSARLSALREVMADPSVGAVWLARGGYGSNRIAEAAMHDLPAAARSKMIMGYSDAGFLLAALHKAGLSVAWGPMLSDIVRPGGDATVNRGLDWLVKRDPAALEGGLRGPSMAFNLTVLSALLGTPLEPDFSEVDLLIEDVGEEHYRLDRTMFHVSSNPNVRKVAGLRLGRISHIPENDPDFGRDEGAIVEEWCARSGIAYGGRADIGHDAGNRVVPFGRQSI